MINRTIGICEGGYIAGGGYSGKTKELDDLILEAAELMAKSFNLDIEIRYNSHRESGGAWLKDGVYNANCGLCANLTNTRLFEMSTTEKINLPDKELINLINNPDTITIYSYISKECVEQIDDKLEQESDTKYWKTLDNGIEYLLKHYKM